METTFLLQKLENYQVFLASQSPRRQELLSQLGIKFGICDSDVNEDMPHDLSMYELAKHLAMQKAESVFQRYSHLENAIVIGGDTIVVVDGEIMGKPAVRMDAFRMLQKLSGKTHSVISGLCVKSKTKTLSAYDEAKVSFDHLSEADIAFYVDTFMPYDKAGAYGIQEWIGCRGNTHIDGSFFTIMGFPTHLLWKMLEEIV